MSQSFDGRHRTRLAVSLLSAAVAVPGAFVLVMHATDLLARPAGIPVAIAVVAASVTAAALGLLRTLGRTTEELNGSRPGLVVQVLSTFPQPAFWKDENLRYLGCNTAFAEVAGFESPEDLVGKTDFDMPWRHHADRYRATDREVMESETAKLGFEEPTTTATGREMWLLSNKVPLRARDGRVTGILGIFEDITERRHLSEALQGSEASLRTILNQIPFDMWVCDAHGRYIMQNAISRQLAGNLMDKTVDDLNVPPPVKDAYRERHLRALNGEVVTEEVEVVTNRGERILDRVLAPIRDGDRIFGFIGMQIDITDRKRIAEELRQHRDNLEDLVRERTRELEIAQEELVRNERLSALGQLTATLAHEIRNPLGTVRAAVFGMGEGVDRNDIERVARARQLAERNIVRCDTIITELLDYSRDRHLQLESTDMDSWLHDVLQEQVAPQRILYIADLQSDAVVSVDREALRRAVINVVENAADAMGGGRKQPDSGSANSAPVSVTTSVHQGRLAISVKDSGQGMKPEVLERVFEPLFSTKTFGVGLGMPIVNGIMERHKGGVEVQSTPGNGTTVTLWLPLSAT